MLLKGVFLGFFGIGVFVLMQVFMPLLAFKTWEVFSYDQNQTLFDPDPSSRGYLYSDTGVSIETINNFPAFVSGKKTVTRPGYQDFKISVPSVNLKNIKVKVASNSFEDYLAQLPGTALPGERGNVFISGHSSLENSLIVGEKTAFFKDLPKLKKGDKILVQALGQNFTYQVKGLKVVDPKDVSVINAPDSEGRFLTLMTCVPPGFNTKRLVVLAELE